MKVILVKKKSLIAGALVICFAVVFIVAAAKLVPAVAQVSAQSRKIPIYSVERKDKAISLSFDAAWGNEDTPTLINILNKYKVHATFFLVGQWVDKYPESVKQLADAGEDVMNHSSTHPHMTQISNNEMLNQITKCDGKIKKITGKTPILFRAPYGDYNNSVVETVKSSGHYCIQWSVDNIDTRINQNAN